MTSEQKQVRDWMAAFGQETPSAPTIPSLETRRLRAKLILEEAFETIHALGCLVSIKDNCTGQIWIYDESFDNIEVIAIDIEIEGTNINLSNILDGCEDLKVVTEGTLVACGLTVPQSSVYRDNLGNVCDNRPIIHGTDPHFNEVMRSNWSKLWSTEEVVDYENDPENKNAPLFFTQVVHSPERYVAKNAAGKVIKSPSYSPPSFTIPTSEQSQT